MRTASLLLLLTLISGCRQTILEPRLGSKSIASGSPNKGTGVEWLYRDYEPNNSFGEVDALSWQRAGKRLIIEAHFNWYLAPLGERWFGSLALVNGELSRPFGGQEELRVKFGDGIHYPVEPEAGRASFSADTFSISFTPATATIIKGATLRVTCDASLLDFEPNNIRFSGVSFDCNNAPCAQVSSFIAALRDEHMAAVDR